MGAASSSYADRGFASRARSSLRPTFGDQGPSVAPVWLMSHLLRFSRSIPWHRDFEGGDHEQDYSRSRCFFGLWRAGHAQRLCRAVRGDGPVLVRLSRVEFGQWPQSSNVRQAWGVFVLEWDASLGAALASVSLRGAPGSPTYPRTLPRRRKSRGFFFWHARKPEARC
jgi:hypothetical protein